MGVLISLTSGTKSWTKITVNALLNFTYGWAKTNNARQKLLGKNTWKRRTYWGKSALSETKLKNEVKLKIHNSFSIFLSCLQSNNWWALLKILYRRQIGYNFTGSGLDEANFPHSSTCGAVGKEEGRGDVRGYGVCFPKQPLSKHTEAMLPRKWLDIYPLMGSEVVNEFLFLLCLCMELLLFLLTWCYLDPLVFFPSFYFFFIIINFSPVPGRGEWAKGSVDTWLLAGVNLQQWLATCPTLQWTRAIL